MAIDPAVDSSAVGLSMAVDSSVDTFIRLLIHWLLIHRLFMHATVAILQ